MIDRTTIQTTSGNGGKGCISGRREKFIPYGGPDGGDGGDGGDIYLEVNPNLSTLFEFQHKKHFKAQNGGDGAGAKKHGKNGGSIRIEVPQGTEIWVKEDGGVLRRLADLTEAGQSLLVARGGHGGRGNARFATSTNQFPLLAEEGEHGQEVTIQLELKLLADVGVVGMPNAGKSSLLAAVSAARPKIADYPFTTLEPVLGVVEHKGRSFVMVDIPGLIEGAHKGAGLGHEFLRHVERTRVLIHLVDASLEDPITSLRQVDKEMVLFDERLAEKPQIIALNKMDIPEARQREPELRQKLAEEGRPAFAVSAATREGIPVLLDAVLELLATAHKGQGSPKTEPRRKAPGKREDELPVLRPKPERRGIEVQRKGDVFVITSPEVTRIAAMVDEANWAARTQFYRRLARTGVVKQLEKLGVKPGDRVRAGKLEWEWE